jgi:hypothetical protein
MHSLGRKTSLPDSVSEISQSFSQLKLKGNSQAHHMKQHLNSEASPRSFNYQPPQMQLDPNVQKFKIN